MIQALNANKRMLLAILITLAIGFNFWIGSRYPNLNGKADEVEIIWPNGEKDVIKGPFLAGARYVITRRS